MEALLVIKTNDFDYKQNCLQTNEEMMRSGACQLQKFQRNIPFGFGHSFAIRKTEMTTEFGKVKLNTLLRQSTLTAPNNEY